MCDFNLSSLLGGASHGGGGGGGGGDATNPLWLAPEVLRGQPGTAASDVYSLGLVLFEARLLHSSVGGAVPRRSVLLR